MLSVEINHFPFKRVDWSEHTPAKQPTVIMGTRTAEKRLETV